MEELLRNLTALLAYGVIIMLLLGVNVIVISIITFFIKEFIEYIKGWKSGE